MGKITPKKSVVVEVEKVMERTPSPAKQSPARVLFGTPKRAESPWMERMGGDKSSVRKGNETQTRDDGVSVVGELNMPVQSGVSTPVRPTFQNTHTSASLARIRKLVDSDREGTATSTRSKYGIQQDTVTAATTTCPPSPSSNNANDTTTKPQASQELRPENIGHMMAGLKTGSFKTFDWAHARVSNEPIKSPVPTPLRRASQRLSLGTPPTFVKLVNKTSDVRVSEPSKKGIVEMQAWCEEKHDNETSLAIAQHGDMEIHEVDVSVGRTTEVQSVVQQVLTNVITAPKETLQGTTSPGLARSILREERVPTPDLEKEAAPPTSNTKVQWQNTDTPLEAALRQIRSPKRRAGTDPAVLLAIQGDAASVGVIKSRSVSSGTAMTIEIPGLPNAVIRAEKSVAVIQAKTTRGQDRLSMAKKADVKPWNAKKTITIGTPRPHLSEVVSNKVSKPPVESTVTVRQRPQTTGVVSIPRRPQVKAITARSKLATTAARPKATTSTSNQPKLPRKSLLATPLRPASRKPGSSNIVKPSVPSTNPRLVGKKNLRAEVTKTLRGAAAKKEGVGADKKTEQEKKSYTPDGSPTKPPSPSTRLIPSTATAVSKAVLSSHACLVPSIPTSKPTQAKVPSPKRTPLPRKPIVRPAQRTALRTPLPSRLNALDRNAFRTPSKAIVDSLDRAIDEKIRFDRQIGALGLFEERVEEENVC